MFLQFIITEASAGLIYAVDKEMSGLLLENGDSLYKIMSPKYGIMSSWPVARKELFHFVLLWQ